MSPGQNRKPGFWTPARRTALKPVATVTTSAITFFILLWATRQGQFADIAGYTAGSSLGAIVAAVAGSGTSLAFITGDRRSQKAVLNVRYIVVLPSLMLAAAASSLVYGFSTELHLLSVAAGGISVALNNLSELESASLERRVDTPRILAASVISRSLGLVAVILGATFSIAMVACAASMYVALRLLSGGKASLSGEQIGLRESLRVAYDPRLMTVSVLGIMVTRAVPVAIPFFMTATDAGALSALISAQQNITAVLISGLYTIMAARSESGALQSWMGRVATMTLAISMGVAVISAVAAPLVIGVLKLGSISGAQVWWVLLSLAVFPFTLNRQTQYSLLASGRRAAAAGMLAVNVLLVLLSGGAAVLLCLNVIWAAVSLISETVVGLAVLTVRVMAKGRHSAVASSRFDRGGAAEAQETE